MSSPDIETCVNPTATQDAQAVEHEHKSQDDSQDDSQEAKETTLPEDEVEVKMQTEIGESRETIPLTDDDISSALKRARAEFNKNRKLIIKGIPPVTYEEVKEFLGGHSVKNISISKKSRHAVVTLLHGEEAEEIVTERDSTKLLDTDVEVEIHPTENLLCIAHLPFDMGDKKFIELVAQYGSIERAFLMRSSGGTSKGYGFVEFAHNPEKSNEVRKQLDGKKIDSFVLECDFVLPHIISFNQLHSCCLLVDQLPTEYKNMMELRDIFSRLVIPPYCQLGMQNGKALGFGIVEYVTADQSETAQIAVNGHMLQGTSIRVTFCIPGEKATDIYNKMMTTVSGYSLKTGLLPNPVQAPPVRNATAPAPHDGTTSTPAQSSAKTPGNLTNPMMQNLLAQNPQVLASFQNVLCQLQQRVQLQQQMQRPGLLGIAPNNQPPSPLLNPNLQIAILAVFMATQLQQTQPGMFHNPLLQQAIAANLQQQNSLLLGGGYMGLQSKKPSLLGNPMIAQANSMLQGLMSQRPSPQQPQQSPQPQQPTQATLCPAAAGSSSHPDPEVKPPQMESDTEKMEVSAVTPQDQAVKDGKPQEAEGDLTNTPAAVVTEEMTRANEASEGETKEEMTESVCEKKSDEEMAVRSTQNQLPQDGTKPTESMPDLHVLNNFQNMLATIQGNIGQEGDSSNATNSGSKPAPTKPATTPPSLLPPANKPGLLGRHPTGMTPQQLVNVMSASSTLQQQQLLNAGAANPILAMFIEAQIRQQLTNLEKVSKARMFMTRLQQQQQPQQQQHGVYHFHGSGGGAGMGAFGRKQGLLGNQPVLNQNAPPAQGNAWYPANSTPSSSGLLKTPSTKPAEDSALSYHHSTDTSKSSQYSTSSSYNSNYYNTCGSSGSASNQSQNYGDWKQGGQQYGGAQQTGPSFQQQYPNYPPYGSPEYRKMYEQYQQYYKMYYQEQNYSSSGSGTDANKSTASYGSQNSSGYGSQNSSGYGSQNSSGYGPQNSSGYGSQNSSGYGPQNNSGYGSNSSYFGGYDSQAGNYDSYSTYGNSSAQTGYGTQDNYGSSQDAYNFNASSYNTQPQGSYGSSGYDFSNSGYNSGQAGNGKTAPQGSYSSPNDVSYTTNQSQNTYSASATNNNYSQATNAGTTTTDTTSQATYAQQQQQYEELYRQYMTQYGAVAQANTTASQQVSPSPILPSLPPPPPPPPAENEPSSEVKMTPTGQKRSYPAHLLPSPEPSPEGQYVGQHSQGLGGHYAETLLVKRRRI